MFFLKVPNARKARQAVILPPDRVRGTCCYFAQVLLSSGNQTPHSQFIFRHFLPVWPGLYVK
jgi:hypothetical protein